MIMLNYNSNGNLSVQLPSGLSSDSYKLYLHVQVIDDSNGQTFFSIAEPVIILPSKINVASLIESLTIKYPSNRFLVELTTGNLNLICKNVISLSSFMNIYESNETNETNNEMALLRNVMLDKIVNLSVSSISSIKLFASTLLVLTKVPQQVSSSLAV